MSAFLPIAEVGFGQDSSRIITGVQPADGTKHFRDVNSVNAGAEPELFRLPREHRCSIRNGDAEGII
jgi:hypothetical protein